MLSIGRSANYNKHYSEEVEFSLKHGFDLLQIWYDRDGIGLNKDSDPRLKVIKKFEHPAIIHALLDVNEIEGHIENIIEMLNYLGHNELIIHPICRSEVITPETIYKLSSKIKDVLGLCSPRGIKVYLENNSKLDPIFTTVHEIEVMFNANPELEFTLDVAHIYDYDHLREMVSVKKPGILHIADKHFDVIHEHLPIGQGEIDFNFVLTEVLNDFDGKIILEIVQSDEEILNSRDVIKRILTLNR